VVSVVTPARGQGGARGAGAAPAVSRRGDESEGEVGAAGQGPRRCLCSLSRWPAQPAIAPALPHRACPFRALHLREQPAAIRRRDAPTRTVPLPLALPMPALIQLTSRVTKTGPFTIRGPCSCWPAARAITRARGVVVGTPRRAEVEAIIGGVEANTVWTLTLASRNDREGERLCTPCARPCRASLRRPRPRVAREAEIPIQPSARASRACGSGRMASHEREEEESSIEPRRRALPCVAALRPARAWPRCRTPRMA